MRGPVPLRSDVALLYKGIQTQVLNGKSAAEWTCGAFSSERERVFVMTSHDLT